MVPALKLPPADACPLLVGMVHALPLPDSPRWGGCMDRVVEAALADAERLSRGGCDALMLENMHDLPYRRQHAHPVTVAAMTRILGALETLGLPLGLQILAGANVEALSVAAVTGVSFIRTEAFAYGHLADEGWMNASAAELLRLRRQLGAEVSIWADVQKKHAAHSATADLSLLDLAQGHLFSGADLLILSGSRTGAATSAEDCSVLHRAGLPYAIGSGVSPTNVSDYLGARALIVGSQLKREGDWRLEVEQHRVRALREALSDACGSDSSG